MEQQDTASSGTASSGKASSGTDGSVSTGPAAGGSGEDGNGSGKDGSGKPATSAEGDSSQAEPATPAETTAEVASSNAARTFDELWADDLAEAVGLSKARYDRATLVRKAKLEGVDTSRWWRAMGLVEVSDDVVAFGREDLAMARALRVVAGQEDIGADHVFRLARLLGGSFSRIAEAQTRVLDDLLSDLTEGELDTPEARADALATDEAEALIELLDQSMTYVWRRHLFAALGRWIGAPPDEEEKACGFVDISGFSQMSKRTAPDVLAEVVERFESEAVDVVSHHGGRVVKFIGDEAFFVVDDIPAAVDVAFEVGDRMSDSDVPVALHTGIAAGPTVSIAGDVFGNTVNLAKRLTDVARKGRIVMPRTDAVALEQRDDLLVRRVARALDLKGVGRTAAVSVTRKKPPE